MKFFSAFFAIHVFGIFMVCDDLGSANIGFGTGLFPFLSGSGVTQYSRLTNVGLNPETVFVPCNLLASLTAWINRPPAVDKARSAGRPTGLEKNREVSRK
jgi:hypothetical protein